MIGGTRDREHLGMGALMAKRTQSGTNKGAAQDTALVRAELGTATSLLHTWDDGG